MAVTRGRGNLLHFIHFIVLYASILWLNVSCSGTSNRTVSFEFNPGCNITACSSGVNGSYVNLAHVSAVGSIDSLHYVTSTIGRPTVLVARIMKKLETLSIDWENLLSKNQSDMQNSIKFNPQPVYSYAVIFNRLIEYNDTNDDSTLNKAARNTTKVHHFSDFKWSSVKNESNIIARTVTFKTSPESSDLLGNGSISFTMRFFNETGRESTLPHLLFNENMTMFDFSIDGVEPSYVNSRFALEMILATSDKPADKMTLNTKNSLDDEYTPGVFKIIDWRSHTDERGGYMQWKPVCYNKKMRSMEVSTLARKYDLKDVGDIPERTVAYAYYGEDLTDRKIAMTATNVSFGLTNDKFYTGTNYTSWSAGIGYGAPSDESLSILVIAIIGAGLGIPVVIIIIGTLVVCIKKRQGQNFGSPQFNHGYTTINA